MRPENWTALLDEHVAEARSSIFGWGSNDCAQFASAWFAKMRGSNPAAQFKGQYSSAIGAQKIILRLGYRDAVDFGRFLFGDPMPSPSYAQRGDIVAAQGGLGICIGAYGVFLTDEGLSLIRSRFFDFAWKV